LDALGAVLRGITEQLASQLQTIQREMDTVRQIQFSILPREIPPIKRFGHCRPLCSHDVGASDFYDFIPINEKRIGIF
jgi:serine phosphatase RsbU (regulator of sigma subunit)